MIATLNGTEYDLSDWTLREPLIGPWRATIRIARAGLPGIGAAVVIASQWFGTVTDAQESGAFTVLECVGGANVLSAPTVPRFYMGGAPIASILADVCGATQRLDAPGSLTAWRSRGKDVVTEVERIARVASGGQWRIGADGILSLVLPSGAAPALKPVAGFRTYESPDLLPLAGLTLDGAIVDCAIHSRGSTIPKVRVYPMRLRAPAHDPQTVAGTVRSQSGARVDVELDDGTLLTGLPLFAAPGVEPTIATGVRVLVLDIDDDPRNTIALAGVDGSLVEMVLAGLHGTVLRDGDKVSISGLTDSLTGPVSGLPMAVTIQLDPLIKLIGPGEPGLGHARVKA